MSMGYSDTVVMAGPGEVLYVVDSGGLGIVQPSAVPFLSDVATTMTRITISHRELYTLVDPLFLGGLWWGGDGDFTFTWNLWGAFGFTDTSTYSSLGYDVSWVSTTTTAYLAGIPTPTGTTASWLNWRTEVGSYIVSSFRDLSTLLIGSTGTNSAPSAVAHVTEPFPVWGKRARVYNGTLTYEEIVQTGVGSTVYDEVYQDWRAERGYASSSGEGFAWSRAYNKRVPLSQSVFPVALSTTSIYSYGQSNGYEFTSTGPWVCDNPASMECGVAYPVGVMTSPESYAGRLSLASTTLTSPTYAYFHRSGGGVALMPTSASYTADVSAVTYTGYQGSESSTFSELLSTIESGATAYSDRAGSWPPPPRESVRMGGAAGHMETIHSGGIGRVKVNGDETYFSPFLSSATESTGTASHVAYPAPALTCPGDYAVAGPFFVLGGYQPQEFLTD
jgi:hypothetical protein